MPITDVPIFSMLRTKMHWHQERQRLLAENVANAETENYRPRDLAPLDFGREAAQASARLALLTTDSTHISATGGSSRFDGERGGYDVQPSGNAVNLEDEMLKVANNQIDYQAATSLYSRSMGLIKTALGKF